MQELKSELRKNAREKREKISDKETKNANIAESLFNLEMYKNAKKVLIYVSLRNEIETYEIITNALNLGKKVAVPYCKDSNGNMDFYLINSLTQLETGSFNVREPKTDECEMLSDFSDSFLIVPGMMFDEQGFRLGYGKGYYDRFLSRFNSISAGLCYDEMLVDSVPRDEYDKSVDIIITQSRIIKCSNGGRHG